jgi:hypothetical protein
MTTIGEGLMASLRAEATGTASGARWSRREPLMVDGQAANPLSEWP